MLSINSIFIWSSKKSIRLINSNQEINWLKKMQHLISFYRKLRFSCFNQIRIFCLLKNTIFELRIQCDAYYEYCSLPYQTELKYFVLRMFCVVLQRRDTLFSWLQYNRLISIVQDLSFASKMRHLWSIGDIDSDLHKFVNHYAVSNNLGKIPFSGKFPGRSSLL